jgi:hypothetical protein
LVEDCETLPDCYGNNPTSPYLFFSLPPHPDDPDSLPPSTSGPLPKVPEGMLPSYRLEANEALVLFGELPPKAKYFGLTPYLFERYVGGEATPIFASLSDTLNHTNIQGADGEVFGERIAVVVSSDAATQAAAHAALIEGGFAEEAINDLVFPPELLQLGLAADDDVLMLLGRVALFEDPTAGQAYLDEVPIEVFRLTPTSSGDALPTPERTPRGDGQNEDDLAPALSALEDAIETSLDADGANYESVQIASPAAVVLAIDPERCLEMNTECLGDNGDALYAAGPLAVFQGSGDLTLAPDESFYLYGVNHVASGKAEYSSAAVYAQAQRVGVASLNDAEMVGSAAAYLPDHPDADKLFVVEVRRDCGDRTSCLEIDTAFPGVPLDANLFFMFRSYVNPGQSVSPAPDEVLGERAIKVLAN